MICMLQAFHPLDLDSLYLYSLLVFYQDTNVELSMDVFRLAFLHMSHLSTCDLLGMVFKHFWNFFDIKDSTSGSIQFHQLISHVATSHIPYFVVHIFGVAKFLTLAKPSGGIWPIVVGEALY